MKGKLIGWTAAGLAGVGLFAGVADAAGNGSTPASSAADVAHPHIGQRAIARVEHRLLAGAVRGELVLDPKKGAQIVDFQRGMTSDASSGAVTVTDKTGTAQSWTVTSSTKICERGASSPKLTDGENVVVVGLKSAGALTARLIVVVPRQAQPTT